MTIGKLVGRDRPASTLAEASAMAAAGQGGVVLVSGEPGIGKSALVAGAAVAAQRDGALVLSGTCWDGDGAPGYWPWVQVVRDYAAFVGANAFERLATAAGVGLDLLLGRAGSVPDDGAFEIFDTVTRLLTDAARDQPVLVVLEDLQWADAQSVRLLDFVQRHAHLSRLLVIGTYRDVEVAAADHPLRAELDAVANTATVVPLIGIDRAAVDELVRHRVDDVDDEVIAELHRRSGGNPFFVEQTIQLWETGGGPSGIAPRVRDAVERRLARLPSEVTDLLASAAIIGAEFDTDVLLGAVDHPAGSAQSELDRAVDARLLRPCDEARLAFVHDLVRETLLRGLGEDDTRRRHASVVAAVDRVPKLLERVHASQVADHAYRAVPLLDASTAVRWLRDAAELASARASFEEAAAQLGRALELEDTKEGWARLALDQAAAQRRAGMLLAARATLDSVEQRGRDHGDAELVARALFELHMLGHGVDETDNFPGGEFAERLDAAYERLLEQPEPTDGALAARLLAATSRARMHLVGGEWDAAQAPSERAVEIARTAGDPDALAFCLLARHDAIWRPGTARERVAITEEMGQAAQASGDREMELQASMLLMVALFELGDPRALDEYTKYVKGASDAGLASVRYVAQTRMACMALLRGEYAEARRLIDESKELGDRLGEIDAFGVWNDQRWQLAVCEGRHDEIEALIETLYGRGDSHRLVLDMSLAIERAEPHRVREMLDSYIALGARWPKWAALFWLASVAEAAELLDDPELVERTIAEVEPFADLWAVLAGGVLVLGPVRLWLGRLVAAQRRWDEAIENYDAAELSATALDAEPIVLWTRYWKARALIGRNLAADAAAARQLLADVVARARALGMVPLADRADALLTTPTPTTDEFRLTEDVWTLTFAGQTAQVPNTKGLADLHTLLAHPGADIPATVLLDPTADPRVAATQHLGADELLDDRARREYRQRLERLDDEIDAALTRLDDDRAAALELERDALLDELRHATGLGGRSRRLGAESERARKTVTARIRDTMKRLDSRHPQLAAHLRDTITTGTTCAYRPTDPIQWKL